MKMEAAFNRRMRKTARTVVWEGAGAQSPAPDPIANDSRIRLFVSRSLTLSGAAVNFRLL
jgi:hypothetical protein